MLTSLTTVVFGRKTVLKKVTDGIETIILAYTELSTAYDLTTADSDPPGPSSH